MWRHGYVSNKNQENLIGKEKRLHFSSNTAQVEVSDSSVIWHKVKPFSHNPQTLCNMEGKKTEDTALPFTVCTTHTHIHTHLYL